jgi:hypothetical protein
MRRFRRSELKSGNERHWSGRGNFELNQLSTEYECLNQLIHYWYCCAAGKHLITCGGIALVMHPTAENSGSKEKHTFDLSAYASDGGHAIAELFCVSAALWPEKMRKTIKKVLKADSDPHRLIFYNQEAKSAYPTKKAGVYIFAIDVGPGAVSPGCCTDPRRLADLWPGDPVSISIGRARVNSDEDYILDLCDEVLSRRSNRPHKFTFSLGIRGIHCPLMLTIPSSISSSNTGNISTRNPSPSLTTK